MVENTRVVPRGVVRSDWEFLCHFWSTAEGKKRAERGRASRDAQDVLHTSGGTSFARRRAIMNVERGGADQYSDLDFFGAIHMNSQGVFLSSKAATISRTARNRYAELSFPSTADFPTTLVDIVQLQHQALVENMGPERHGCVRGKGLGPTPSRTCASSSTQPDPRDEKISILETQVANLQATVAHIAHIMWETNVQNPANILRQQKFDYPAVLDAEWVNKSMSKKWRDYKVELKTKYYDENRTMAENARVVPRGVVRSDWEFLCHFWSTPEGKKRAERGRASRDAQDVLHTAGGTSFARRRAIMDGERGGADQYGDLDFFDATHMNSQGVFPSSKAAMISTTARNRYVELSSAPTAGFPTTPIDIVQLQHQALVENMGPERHGRVRGKGLGPTPSRTHASSSTQPDPRDEKIANLEMQVAELKATVAHIAQMMRETNVQNPSNIPRQQGVRDPTSSSRPNEEEADDLGDPVDGIARRTL